MAQGSLGPEFIRLIRETLLECGIQDVGEITADLKLSELGLDSVGAAEMLIVLEDEYDITLKQQEVMALETLGDVKKMTDDLRGQGVK